MATVSEAVVDALLASASVSLLAWAAYAVHAMLEGRADRRRLDEAARREAEYHEERMRALRDQR